MLRNDEKRLELPGSQEVPLQTGACRRQRGSSASSVIISLSPQSECFSPTGWAFLAADPAAEAGQVLQ